MSITSSFYTGLSGLDTHATAMQVIGDNISNVHTTGFKSSSTLFEDVLGASLTGVRGSSQTGAGAQVSAVDANFTQGSLETTDVGTDVAINGQGFFAVSDPITDEKFYTRAGHFIVNNQGYLVNSQGFQVQGYLYESQGLTLIENLADIHIDQNSMIPPKVTGEIDMVLNLDASLTDKVWDSDDPFSTSHFSTTTNIYDSLGQSHQIQVYFTKTADQTWDWNALIDGADVQGGTPGDLYQYGNGQLVFDTSGQLTTSMSPPPTFGIAYTSITAGPDDVLDSALVPLLGDDILVGTRIHAGGVDSVVENPAWTGTSSATSSGNYTGTIDHNYTLTVQSITGTGLVGTDTIVIHWQNTDNSSSGDITLDAAYVAAAAVDVENGLQVSFSAGLLAAGATESFTVGTEALPAARVTAGPNLILDTPIAGDDVVVDSTIVFANGLTPPATTIDFTGTSQYGSASVIQVLTQDGYAAGTVSGVSIDEEGNMVANYTNGTRKKIARLALADFPSLNGLARKGASLYQATTNSGDALYNKPGVGGLGTLSSSMLEESNVDLAGEFIKMIVIQRGYQANTKVITTTDEMLAQLINIK